MEGLIITLGINNNNTGSVEKWQFQQHPPHIANTQFAPSIAPPALEQLQAIDRARPLEDDLQSTEGDRLVRSHPEDDLQDRPSHPPMTQRCPDVENDFNLRPETPFQHLRKAEAPLFTLGTIG